MNSAKARTFGVVGRGIAGLMAAYHLHRAGYGVTVFGKVEDQASRAAQGILCNKGLIFFESPLFRSKLESLAAMQTFLDRLEKESGHLIPRFFTGVSEPYWSPEDYQATVARVYRHKFWGCHQTEDRGPWAAMPESRRIPLGQLVFPSDGWYDPLAALNALEAYLRDRGVLIVEERVAELFSVPDAGVVIQTNESQAEYAFDRMVMAAGAGTKGLWEKAGLAELKMFLIGGQTLSLARNTSASPKIMVKGTRSITLLPHQGILGSSSWKGHEAPDLKADADDILKGCEEQFGLNFTGIYESRIGTRFRFKDRMPLVGWVSRGRMAKKLYLMTGFYKNGMHLAEICAREMLLDIGDRAGERRYSAFSPLRFSV